MKICDAADWFNPDFHAIITNDLHDIPRFHRKQWEFAAILNALSKAGALHPEAVGISFGAGLEPPVYAIANRVRHIWATDLYNDTTAWPTARKDDAQSATEFVRAGSPFPTHVDRISAKSMDMRTIEFDDETFDFAYSSSAVEHIGGWDDFARHLQEVRRVLKPGGTYVMTTDISFGVATHQPGNFKFTPEGLQWWLQTSGMQYEPVIDCRIAHHSINTPLPPDFASYLAPGGGKTHLNLADTSMGIFGLLSMVECLVGAHPHASVMLVMTKNEPTHQPVACIGFEETKTFLFSARDRLGEMLEGSTLCAHPNLWTPDNKKTESFTTSYMWLGTKPRIARVRITVDQPGHVALGVNTAFTDHYWEPSIEHPEAIYPIQHEAEFHVPLACAEGHTYALYGRALPGTNLKHVDVTIEPCHADTKPANPATTPVAPRPAPPTSSQLKQTARAILVAIPGVRQLVEERSSMRAEIEQLNKKIADYRLVYTLPPAQPVAPNDDRSHAHGLP